ncbi:hypothetical protein ANCCEY_11241 [Ancylostoma ceylanicum]|uniref:Uncharacterized protein n=1 Tax=Ancylostoma ceylanicum TaxID=53326 RepID=A0A0D6LEN6_9BILA|nr:hypothetical protein ANCCEY_11241 [Ancylostoma ceylanicum]
MDMELAAIQPEHACEVGLEQLFDRPYCKRAKAITQKCLNSCAEEPTVIERSHWHFVKVSRWPHGYGPKLLGVFSGGRIEEFIPSRTLTTEEMSDARFAPSLATLNAKLNNIEMPLPKSPQLVFLCRSWLAKYVSNGGGSLTMEQTAVHGHVEKNRAIVLIVEMLGNTH